MSKKKTAQGRGRLIILRTYSSMFWDIIIPNITIIKDTHITKVKFSLRNKIPNEQVTKGTK